LKGGDVKKEAVNIYGAGMSGLIAAINLARDGYEVVVHDREKGYGGDPQYNPSAHTTPIDVKATSEYIGIDISPAFHEVIHSPFYFHDTRIDSPQALFHDGVYTVERGNRPTSLDTLLYKECNELGVQFSWEDPLKKEDIDKLPKNTIVACGLTPSAYEMLDIPYLRWYGWISRGEIGFSNISWCWLDEGITEYGYLSSVNNYYFDLLFSIEHVSKESLEKYQDFMVRNEGVEHKEWVYSGGAVPIARPDNPRLFHKDLILAGTISGAMDPMLWFGILGATVTGKVAALAITDRERAIRDFQRFNRFFKPAFFIKNMFWYRMRPHVGPVEKMINLVGPRQLESVMKFLSSKKVTGSIPGFARSLGSC
jgi:flavin-dependent dehydrogenase